MGITYNDRLLGKSWTEWTLMGKKLAIFSCFWLHTARKLRIRLMKCKFCQNAFGVVRMVGNSF